MGKVTFLKSGRWYPDRRVRGAGIVVCMVAAWFGRKEWSRPRHAYALN